MATKDQKEIGKIMNELCQGLGPGKGDVLARTCGKLCDYVNAERMRLLGWAHADACVAAKKGIDVRATFVSLFIARAEKDLELLDDELLNSSEGSGPTI